MLNKHSSQEYENITTDFEYEWYLFLVFKIITRIVYYLLYIELQKLYWLSEYISEMLHDFITVHKYYV
jgi:hypothetical protein